MSGHHETNKLIARIIDVNCDGLEQLTQKLSEVFSSYGIRYLALYSPAMMKSETLELVASSTDAAPQRMDQSVAIHESLFFDANPVTPSMLFLVAKSEKMLPQNTAIRKTISNKIKEIIYNVRQLIRRSVIEQSVRSRDMNSFVYRLARTLKKTYLIADEISVFIWDNRQQKIYLSATTSEVRSLKTKDIYYKISDQFPTVQAITSNMRIIEDDSTHIRREEFDSNLDPIKLYARGFWPISLVNSNFSEVSSHEISPIGVIRISNPRRVRSSSAVVRTVFTEFDHSTTSFVCEVMFVLLQIYVQFSDIESDFARLTHGLGANIDAALKFAGSLRESLFDERDSEQVVAKFVPSRASDASAVNDIFYDINELENFLGDLHFQFGKVDPKTYQTEVVEGFHSDVLMPAARLVPAIAAVNSKGRPILSNFKDRGSLSIPKVMGNKDGFISVLRNLFENSIKYTTGYQAKIDLNFVVDGELVIIDYFDNGIGIADNETEQIFVEGFRSVNARRVNNRGIGIGLTYSRDVMRSFSGDLECIPAVRGAHFKIKIKRA